MSAIIERLGLYARLVRIDKPIGILLLMWPTLWGLWTAAGGAPPWHIFVIFVLGTALMRSAGCAINDYFDRDIDLHVQRTEQRVLTTGRIRPSEALGVAAVLALISLALVIPLNPLSWALAVVAAVLLLEQANSYAPRFLDRPLENGRLAAVPVPLQVAQGAPRARRCRPRPRLLPAGSPRPRAASSTTAARSTRVATSPCGRRISTTPAAPCASPT